MDSKELYAIREWAPLTDILERIPARVQKGLFSVDLNITCIDAVPEFLALGSNAGIVFWYSRHSGEVQKLRAETTARITCVKIVNSVEYMVAAGNDSGQVSVFQIQKELHADLNLVTPYVRAKPNERYTIRDLHHSSITCCEWSKNGMKLYSGDRQGVVVLTEFDYQNHISKSSEILNEAYEIVQLSVQQSYLLVSTLYRSIVCQRKHNGSNEWQITQIGKKDRKQLVDCGGTFLKGAAGKQQQLLLCGRPGLRFWLADTEGNVEKTLLFKEAVSRSATWDIPILNPKSAKNTPVSDGIVDAVNFGPLYLYNGSDALIVTYDDDAKLYILNLTHLRVEAVAKGCRKICNICVCDKEIFVLEGERSLLRLAPMPEKPNKIAKVIFNPSMPPPLPLLGVSSNAVESPVEYELEEEAAVINAEECFELPPIEEINMNIPIELAVESPRSEQNRRLEIFQQISEMDFDNSILHHSGLSANGRSKRSKRKNSGKNISAKSEGIVEIGRQATTVQSKEQQEKPKHLEFTTNQGTLMDASFCTETSNSSNKTTFRSHLPDALSPDTLQKTIELKAKQLAEEYDIPALKLGPITAEELRESLALSAPPQTEQTQQTKALWQLPLIYPQQHLTQVEDAGVQTTPRKKNYLISDDCDFSTGQPVDDICQTLRGTAIGDVHSSIENATSVNSNDLPPKHTLQFVSSQPVGEDVNSFLLDFSRARDPTLASPPPASGDSNTSSEWEFLDN